MKKIMYIFKWMVIGGVVMGLLGTVFSRSEPQKMLAWAVLFGFIGLIEGAIAGILATVLNVRGLKAIVIFVIIFIIILISIFLIRFR